MKYKDKKYKSAKSDIDQDQIWDWKSLGGMSNALVAINGQWARTAGGDRTSPY